MNFKRLRNYMDSLHDTCGINDFDLLVMKKHREIFSTGIMKS